MKSKASLDSVVKMVEDEVRYLDYKLRGPAYSVGEWLLALEAEVQKAKAAWNNHLGDIGVLNEVRQAAGIAFACMLQHGAPVRHPSEVR